LIPKSRKQRAGIEEKKKPSTRNGPLDHHLSECTTEKDEIEGENFEDVSEDSASIISIVKNLEEQVEAAFNQKEVLEAELDATKKRLSEELAVRAQLEARVISLEAQVARAEHSREDISFAEEDRDKSAKLPAETQPSASKPEPLSTREEIRSIIAEELARLQAAEEKAALLNLEKRVRFMAETIEALQNRIMELSACGPVSEADMWEAVDSLDAAESLTDDERAILVNVFRQNITLQKPELVGVAVD